MTNEEKLKTILPWIDQEERITVTFLDEQGLNGEVTGCSDEIVDLSLETRIPHIKQHISVPLRLVEISEDPSHYTWNPDRPLQLRRLMLLINDKRPPIIY